MGRTEIVTIKSGIFSKIVEAIVYTIIINLSYLIPMYIDITNKYTDVNFEAYSGMWIYISLGAFLIMLFNKMFQTLKLSKTENILIVLTSTIMNAFAVTVIAFFIRSLALPRSIVLIGFVVQTILLVLIKCTMKVVYDKTKKEKNVVIYTSLNLVEDVIEKLFGSSVNIKERLVFVAEYNKFDVEKLNNIQKVYIYDMYEAKNIDDIIHNCILKGIQICVIPKSYELTMKNASFYLKTDVPLLRINQVGLSLEYRIIKRTMDIVLSLLAIVITAPVMIITALVIYFKDGKNILYKQKRLTIQNKIFTVYKFRTMIVEAEKDTGIVWASEDDPRITKVGSFLRKYWIDELPQFFNILKGDMSFVGPRPERPELVEKFVKQYPDFKFRTIAKAGLTGYAQVMAKYDTTPEYKLKFDLFYILNTNLIFDLNIIIMTVRKIFLRLVKQEKKWNRYIEILDRWDVESIEKKDNTLYFKYGEKGRKK